MRVQLLITCLIDSLFPGVGEAVLEVLTRTGVDVGFPGQQTCCGQPAMNAGFREQAARMARHTIRVFGRDPSAVVVPSGSCAAMIRHGYPELLSADPKWLRQARDLADRTYEFSQFLVDELRLVDLGTRSTSLLAYHPSCHLLRSLGVDRQPMNLLKQAAVSPVERLEPECCGFGGVFAVNHANISVEMADRALEGLGQTGAEVIVGCDASCLMQLEGRLRHSGSQVRCAHLAQILAGQQPGLR